jgi:hypothetical protein
VSEPESTQRNRRLFVALGGVCALALLFVLVVQPLLFGGEGEAADVAIAQDDEAEAMPDPVEGEGDAASEPIDVSGTRDPFKQLVVTLPPAEPVEASSAEGTPTEPTEPVAGSEPPAPTDGDEAAEEPATDPPDPPPAEPAQPAGTTVQLIGILAGEGKRALVTVDGSGYKVSVGETVAGKVALVDVWEQCAGFRIGDDRFSLCEGEQITK